MYFRGLLIYNNCVSVCLCFELNHATVSAFLGCAVSGCSLGSLSRGCSMIGNGARERSGEAFLHVAVGDVTYFYSTVHLGPGTMEVP